MPAYRAGKPAASEDLKLSSNENPFGPLPGVLDRAVAQVARMNRYPDAGVTDLTSRLAQRHGVTDAQIAVGTGSVAVLFAALHAFCSEGDEVVHAWRSFEAYPIAIGLSGATSVPVALRPDFGHDLDAMAAAITERTRAVLVCTPNNPTGPVVTQAEFDDFIARVPDHVLVIVDEAYLEFVRRDDAMAGLRTLAHPQVLVLRTFSKAYGLAGLRVGYAIADPEVAGAIRKVLPPFGVSDVAQHAALASLDAEVELAERIETIVAERERVAGALRAAGWRVPESHGNFVWIDTDDPGGFADRCAPVSVRPFPEGVRITIGERAVNDALIANVGEAPGTPGATVDAPT